MSLIFFFNDTATTEIYTLSLHDALPISSPASAASTHAPSSTVPRTAATGTRRRTTAGAGAGGACVAVRSEEHTSELQSHVNLVCRLLLEKKKNASQHVGRTDGRRT